MGSPTHQGPQAIPKARLGTLQPSPRAATGLANAEAQPHERHVISVVLPCLNEAGSVGRVVAEVLRALAELGLDGEVLVADNGSTDDSVAEARAAGARVVIEPRRGYGFAYHGGIAAAHGDWIVMADADGTYDLSADGLRRLLGPLADGTAEMVVGNRFAGGLPARAMPWSHRYIGNPLLSGILRLLFGSPVRDAHCGLRAFTRQVYDRLRLRTGGMEYASEMIVRASQLGVPVAEIPVAYRPRVGTSKLRTVPDGWRHLCLMLLYSPTHLFVYPGLALLAVGLVVLLALAPGPIEVAGLPFDYHVMFVGSLAFLIGIQALSLGFIARVYAVVEGFGREDSLLRWFLHAVTMQRAMLLGALLVAIGLTLNLGVVVIWASHGFANLNALRPALVALTFTVAGINLGLSALFISALLLPRLR